MGHLLKDCPLNKNSEDSPKATPIPSRGASPVIPRPSQGNATAHATPMKAGTKGLGSSSPPLTRARATAAAAQVSGTALNPSSFSFGISSSLVISNAPCTMAHCIISTPLMIASTAPPTLPTSSSSSSLSSPKMSTSHHFSLCPRTHNANAEGPQVGLGIVSLGMGPLSSRGRKSDLSKAIKRVGAEVTSGLQSTLEGVLRASLTPRRVPP